MNTLDQAIYAAFKEWQRKMDRGCPFCGHKPWLFATQEHLCFPSNREIRGLQYYVSATSGGGLEPGGGDNRHH